MTWTGLTRWVGWSVGTIMAIDLSKETSYGNWGQCILFAVGLSLGGVKGETQNWPQPLEYTGLSTLLNRFAHYWC